MEGQPVAGAFADFQSKEGTERTATPTGSVCGNDVETIVSSITRCSSSQSGEASPSRGRKSKSDIPLSKSSASKNDDYRHLFHLPPEETLIEDFNCALQKKILLQGHMYLFDRYVCFYSNIFGYEKKKVIPLKDVTCVRKAKTAGVFPNAVEIIAWGKKHFFASFISRDEAYKLIVLGWSAHSRYAKLFLGSSLSLHLGERPSSAFIQSMSGERSRRLSSPELGGMDADDTRDVQEVPGIDTPGSPSNEDSDDGDAHLRVVQEDEGEPRNVDILAVDNCEGGIVVGTAESTGRCWAIEDIDPPPTPESLTTIVEAEFPVSVEEFFHLFFSDHAVGFLRRFHEKRGDEEFSCSSWAQHKHLGRVRSLSFRHPINFFIGPKATYCQQTQTQRVYRGGQLVIETVQQMADIPYGDYFQVAMRWAVTANNHRPLSSSSGSEQSCSLRMSIHVPFSKKTVLRGQIEKGALDETRETYTHWLREAQALLMGMRSTAGPDTERGGPGGSGGGSSVSNDDSDGAGGEGGADDITARVLSHIAERRIPAHYENEIRRMLNLNLEMNNNNNNNARDNGGGASTTANSSGKDAAAAAAEGKRGGGFGKDSTAAAGREPTTSAKGWQFPGASSAAQGVSGVPKALWQTSQSLSYSAVQALGRGLASVPRTCMAMTAAGKFWAVVALFLLVIALQLWLLRATWSQQQLRASEERVSVAGFATARERAWRRLDRLEGVTEIQELARLWEQQLRYLKDDVQLLQGRLQTMQRDLARLSSVFYGSDADLSKAAA